MKTKKRSRPSAQAKAFASMFRAAQNKMYVEPYSGEGSFSCCAIGCIGAASRRFYAEMFELGARGFWDDFLHPPLGTVEEYYTARIVALELAALLALDGFTVEDFT